MRSLNLDGILSVDSPWAYFVACEEGDIDSFALRWRHREDKFVLRILRGRRCSDEQRLFQEWAAALQFPYYFGENWDAFDECLADLEWMPARAYLFAITNIDGLLRRKDREFQIFMSILDKVAAEWATPVAVDAEWDRPAIPFRVMFHSEPRNETKARQRLEQAGVELYEL